MPKSFCQCGRLIQTGTRCRGCGKGGSYRPDKTASRGTTNERGYGRDWQLIRGYYLADNPLCERCLDEGFTTAADEVHHKIPISQEPELRLERSNLQSVCKACHIAIHKRACDQDAGARHQPKGGVF